MRINRLLNPGRPMWIDELFEGFLLKMKISGSLETAPWCFHQRLNSGLGGRSGGSSVDISHSCHLLSPVQSTSHVLFNCIFPATNPVRASTIH